ncbi:KPN_02809 family neutral zinc metallopeptidase [Hyphomonas pacifica]|uniref:Metalloprotease n=1 Tax=Hyphomonas pacifica TaxID=1280941 RepID=A0A062U228_9PROT|nr:neutral zinc metallopeptidase [Hyphomonas pacifica]KCZ49488.1 metalloprotease [Hyphomonas pacifica]MBR9806172.1 flagellar biosynthesis protein FlgM [Alphaproteobacteria bacterium]RAN32002.1 metalloprotease [Hyphomonas pacifica]RAN34726.1 metalloprotease [Hyphomonas pacifica]
MRWQGGRRGGNVEDRRGLGPGKAVGGGSLIVVVIALVGYFVFGMEPKDVERLIESTSTQTSSQQSGEVGTPEDQAGQFVDVVGANINDVWNGMLPDYREPTVVLYTQGTSTGCGYGQAAMGPFYCPNDQTVYLDLSFWQQMEDQLGASGAEFARAYVIAHEFGHHVQTLTGTSQQVRQAQQKAGSQAEANKYSVALELQADCYAGVWAANAAKASNGTVALEPGDMREGLKTANAIGDDMLQKRSQGRVTPEAFTHGSAEQRMTWLNRGYETGDPRQCDTFN